MSAKSVKYHSNSVSLAATGASPADFPLGSPESRAAARTMANEKAAEITLNADDEDALMLCRLACFLDASNTPNYYDLESTSAYRRGKELAAIEDDEMFSGWSEEQLNFFVAYGRAANPGDVLLPSDLEEADHYLIRLFIEAWGRQIPQWPCPLRLQDDKLYRRVRTFSLSLCAPYGSAAITGLLEVGDGFAWIQDQRRGRPEKALVFVSESEWRPATEEEANHAENSPHGPACRQGCDASSTA